MSLLQHGIITDCCGSRGSGKQQSGQSPKWLPSGCLNKISSFNSAARIFHSVLCCFLWSFWHFTLQYRTRKQPLHRLNFMSSLLAVPQEAHNITSSRASFSFMAALLILLQIKKLSPKTTEWNAVRNNIQRPLPQRSYYQTKKYTVSSWLARRRANERRAKASRKEIFPDFYSDVRSCRTRTDCGKYGKVLLFLWTHLKYVAGMIVIIVITKMKISTWRSSIFKTTSETAYERLR